MIRVMLVDDHLLLRQGLRKVLELEKDLEVVGEASNGEQALRVLESLNPDVILLDLNMPGISGLEVLRRARESYPSVHLIALTIQEDEDYVLEAVRSGASGYLLKDVEPSDLAGAIRIVAGGGTYIYPRIAIKLVAELQRLTARKSGEREEMTTRELEVLVCVAEGLSNQEIADRLFLSEKTVKNHLTNLFRKIGVSDRTQAAMYAVKHRLVKL